MKYGRYGWSYIFLTWGLGITFLWIGVDMILHPDLWIGYVPQGIPGGISREATLKAIAGFDIALGAAFILRFWPKWTAGLAALHLAGILITQGINAVLVRDIGLLGSALALFTWPNGYRRKRWFKKIFRRKNKPSEIED